MTMISTPDVAAEVRAVIAKRRVSQGDLAKVLHTSRMAVSRRMNGHVPFTADELIILAQHFGIPVGAFFGEVAA